MVKNKKKIKTKLKKFTPKKRLNRFTLVISVLLVAILGVSITYFLLAASFNSNDEKVQYNGINFTRAYKGLSKTPATKCLNSVARSWSKHMSDTNTFAHNPNFASQITTKCGGGWSWLGENIAHAAGCNNPPSDGCSQALFDAFLKSPGHYANITYPGATNVGVGAYRDNKGNLWITQEFAKCVNCGWATYTPTAWYLTGSSAAASSTAAKALNITVNRGQTVTFYNHIKNWGPNTATFSKYIRKYHYSASGSLLFSSTIENSTISLASGASYSYTYNTTLDSSHPSGEKLCTVIFYGAATGPGTAGSHSSKSCAKFL